MPVFPPHLLHYLQPKHPCLRHDIQSPSGSSQLLISMMQSYGSGATHIGALISIMTSDMRLCGNCLA